MYHTVEVRWFIKGNIPPEVWTWISQHGPVPVEPAARVDHYLRITEGDSLGVKLREGRIEVKQRYSQPAVVRFADHAVGTVERWCKWSFELAEAGEFPELGGHKPGWIGVVKERLVHTFQVQRDESVIRVPLGVALGSGCGCEVARVKIAESEEQWWSVGFEAFGHEADRWHTLLLVAKQLLSASTAPPLGLDASDSYPSWLQNLMSG